MGTKDRNSADGPKGVLVGINAFRPTIPPEGDAPSSSRHPTCGFCQNQIVAPTFGHQVGKPFETPELHDLKEWEVLFVCHGRMDPTDVVQITIRFAETVRMSWKKSEAGEDVLELVEDLANGAEIVRLQGAAAWRDARVHVNKLLGSAVSPADYRITQSVSRTVQVGRFLVFEDNSERTHVMRVPIAHMVGRRG